MEKKHKYIQKPVRYSRSDAYQKLKHISAHNGKVEIASIDNLHLKKAEKQEQCKPKMTINKYIK